MKISFFETRTGILFYQSRVSRREREIENDFSRSSGKKLSWFSREFPSLSAILVSNIYARNKSFEKVQNFRLIVVSTVLLNLCKVFHKCVKIIIIKCYIVSRFYLTGYWRGRPKVHSAMPKGFPTWIWPIFDSIVQGNAPLSVAMGVFEYRVHIYQTSPVSTSAQVRIKYLLF